MRCWKGPPWGYDSSEDEFALQETRPSEGYYQAPYVDSGIPFGQPFGGYPQTFQSVGFMPQPMLPMPFPGPYGGMMGFQEPMGLMQPMPPHHSAPPVHLPAAPKPPPPQPGEPSRRSLADHKSMMNRPCCQQHFARRAVLVDPAANELISNKPQSPLRTVYGRQGRRRRQL